MYKKALLVLLTLSLFVFAIPAVAAPSINPGGEPLNQDFPDPYSPGGGPRCWECVPSVSAGLVCRNDFIGYHGCNKGWLYTTGEDGQSVTTPTCIVIPYGFCITLLP